MGGHTVAPDPFQRFEEEHAEALRELQRLEHAAMALENGERPSSYLRIVREVHTFLSTAVRTHNENEERALFGLLGEDAPVALFEEEHRMLRTMEHDLGRALDGRDPVQDIPPIARELIGILRAHIEREDQVLFPMARALLGPEGTAVVARRLAST